MRPGRSGAQGTTILIPRSLARPVASRHPRQSGADACRGPRRLALVDRDGRDDVALERGGARVSLGDGADDVHSFYDFSE